MPPTIVSLELDRLTLDYYCTSCNGMMVPTRTHAGEKSLTCCRCSHEVAYATRFASCRIAEWSPVIPAECCGGS